MGPAARSRGADARAPRPSVTYVAPRTQPGVCSPLPFVLPKPELGAQLAHALLIESVTKKP
jgi:hypothetical protein